MHGAVRAGVMPTLTCVYIRTFIYHLLYGMDFVLRQFGGSKTSLGKEGLQYDANQLSF